MIILYSIVYRLGIINLGEKCRHFSYPDSSLIRYGRAQPVDKGVWIIEVALYRARKQRIAVASRKSENRIAICCEKNWRKNHGGAGAKFRDLHESAGPVPTDGTCVPRRC